VRAATGTAFDWLGLVVTALVIPAVVTLTATEIMRNKGYIQPGDLKIEC
jgi:uncharacterized membrane protein